MGLRLSENGSRPGAGALMAALMAALLSLAPAAPAVPAGNIVAYEIADAREIPESLTGEPGDAEAGRKLYFDRKLTRCAGCHGAPDASGAGADPGAGEAPSLAGVAGRMSEGAVRLWLVAPQVIAPDTRMPGYYRLGQRDDPADPRYGEPLLTAAEIEDLVAYLMLGTGSTKELVMPAPDAGIHAARPSHGLPGRARQ